MFSGIDPGMALLYLPRSQVRKVPRMTVHRLIRQLGGVSLAEARLAAPAGGTLQVTYVLRTARRPCPEYFQNRDAACQAFDREVALGDGDAERSRHET